MPKEKELISTFEVACIVDNEGLDYAITSYIGSKDFEDRDLADLWTKAKKLLNQIQAKLDAATAAAEGPIDE